MSEAASTMNRKMQPCQNVFSSLKSPQIASMNSKMQPCQKVFSSLKSTQVASIETYKLILDISFREAETKFQN